MSSLDLVQSKVADYMYRIARLFKAGARISIFVRHDGFPERDFVMTNDDLSAVIQMIERRQVKP